MKLNFNLKKAGKRGDALIFLVLRDNNKKTVYSTGQTIPPKYWSKELQRPTKGYPYKSELDKFLSDLMYIANSAYFRLKNENGKFPTLLELRTELDTYTERNQVKTITLFEFIEKRLNDYQVEKKSIWAIKKHRTLLEHLKDYCKTYGKPSLNFNDISQAFFEQYKTYSFQILKHNPNTVNRLTALIKSIMKDAKRLKHHHNTDYEFFSVLKVPTHEIYLNESELERIYKLDLSDKKGHDIVRDFFIIGCFSGGLRFSDWASIRPNQIQEKNGIATLTVTTQKTNQTVSFPMSNQFVKEILSKYNNELPKPLSNVKTNLYLKQIGEWANITANTPKIEYQGGVKTEVVVPKYTMIGTHTARRSFATNLYLHKVPLSQIRGMTGHTTDKQLSQYIKIGSLENALQLANTAFF
jgi:integrase